MTSDLFRLLEVFAEAWNAHDVDALLSCMTEDAVFRTAAGAAPAGDVHQGHAELRAAFTAIFARFPDARWNNAIHSVMGDVALSEWTFSGTDVDGNKVLACGCDIFRLRNGMIAIKDTFRKQTLPSLPSNGETQ